MTESLIVFNSAVKKVLTCKKLWLAMIRASWAPSSSGWAWLLLMPCTNWGMLSATACNCTQHMINICKSPKLPRYTSSMTISNISSGLSFPVYYLRVFFNTAKKKNTRERVHDRTLQLCTSCWCETVFLLEAAAFWAAAIV